MGLLLDIVPNHMCIASSENRWWNDVLENGPSSPHARYFDIDWQPPKADLADKVLLPTLGDQYGRVLENGQISLVRQEGSFYLRYYETVLPVAPKTWQGILRPALRLLRNRLGRTDRHVLELESILTAVSHLPARTDTDPAQVHERQREKEIVKERLSALISACDDARVSIDRTVAKLNGKPGDPRSFDRLESLLADQAFRLSYWRVASDEINYRRFFDINELAAIRVEDEDVFDEAHALPFRLIAEGTVTGLRVDHVDGLIDPEDYLSRLRAAVPGDHDKPVPTPAGVRTPFFVVVEKILGGDEALLAHWPVTGTTGYEYLNSLNGVFIDPRGRLPLEELYTRVTGLRQSFPDVVYQSKKLVLQVAMSSELTVLSRKLHRISEQHRYSRDFTLNSLQDALAEVIACFPVYRSYVRVVENHVRPDDRRYISTAIHRAKRRNPATSESLFEFIASVLPLDDPEGLSESERAERRDFVMRFQQLTSPVMAKGLEDTAFYRYHPLVSLNEVGGDPNRFGISVEDFHLGNRGRQRTWPTSLLATSTHDTKRDEDVRARINVLSEIPDRWEQAVLRWREMNGALKSLVDGAEAPSSNEEYLFYQTLVGAWPAFPMDDDGHRTFLDRMRAYMLKALREAKQHTSWISPHEAYEQALGGFVSGVLDPKRESRFLEDFARFHASILCAGLLNAISQTVLKIASPGVPDFYQGTEMGEFRLVDPDNRGRVDFERRRSILDRLDREAQEGAAALAARLLDAAGDGRLKLYVTSRALRLRRAQADLFVWGEYIPLSATGKRQEHVVALARARDDQATVSAAARFFTRLAWPPTGPEAWEDTVLRLEPRLGGSYRAGSSATCPFSWTRRARTSGRTRKCSSRTPLGGRRKWPGSRRTTSARPGSSGETPSTAGRFSSAAITNWWIARLRRAFEHFDVVRLDHFIGFLRSWAVPAGALTAAQGRWVRGPGASFFETVRRRLGPVELIAENLGGGDSRGQVVARPLQHPRHARASIRFRQRSRSRELQASQLPATLRALHRNARQRHARRLVQRPRVRRLDALARRDPPRARLHVEVPRGARGPRHSLAPHSPGLDVGRQHRDRAGAGSLRPRLQGPHEPAR
jgi:(1->4)-alpha-D-glucan 1-alpha-D-glucosylmutase